MVCYYGRQVCKTGLSTNEPGLKMSGIGGFGGSKGAIRRYISRRVVSNLKPCGPIYRHGVITGFRTTRCVKRASKCASIAGGVGRKSNPRFSCGKPQAPQLEEKELALMLLQNYFRKDNLLVVLTAKNETLVSDGVHHKGFQPITHYFEGSPAYEGIDGYPTLSKSVKKSIDLLNGFRYTEPLTKGGTPQVHVVSTVSIPEALALFKNGFGVFEKVDNSIIVAFGVLPRPPSWVECYVYWMTGIVTGGLSAGDAAVWDKKWFDESCVSKDGGEIR